MHNICIAFCAFSNGLFLSIFITFCLSVFLSFLGFCLIL